MGNEQEPIFTNRHHVFFERRNYTTPIEKRIRNMGAFVIKANAVDHRELHAHVEPPQHLTPDQMHDLYQFMQEHAYDIESLEGLEWGIVWAVDRRIKGIEENFQQQHHYISGEYRK